MTLQEAKDIVYKKAFEDNGTMWMPTRFEYSKMDNEAAEIYAEAKAKEFAEWVNENYTLVTSEELQKSAWVNLKRSVYVNGSDFHYTQMINEFGETIEQLYKNYNQNG